MYLEIPDWGFVIPDKSLPVEAGKGAPEQRDGFLKKPVRTVMKPLRHLPINVAHVKPTGIKKKEISHRKSLPVDLGETNATVNKTKEHRKSIVTKKRSPMPVNTRQSVSSMQLKMQEQLKGAKFRWINEKLYTTTGAAALEFMRNDPTWFDMYHEGFRQQVLRWPINPIDVYLKELHHHGASKAKLTIADCGCGEAALAQGLSQYTNLTIHSFDLLALNNYVTTCDMTNLPLKDGSVDKAIFSLSLMGTNYVQFLMEAHRILKFHGVLNIAEVESRMTNVDNFIALVEKLGFKHRHTENVRLFVFLEFSKAKRGSSISEDVFTNSATILKPCLYKKR